MFIGKRVKFKKPFINIDSETFTPITITEGVVFHEYICHDKPIDYMYNCVVVDYSVGYGTFPLKDIIFDIDYLNITKDIICKQSLEFVD